MSETIMLEIIRTLEQRMDILLRRQDILMELYEKKEQRLEILEANQNIPDSKEVA